MPRLPIVICETPAHAVSKSRSRRKIRCGAGRSRIAKVLFQIGAMIGLDPLVTSVDQAQHIIRANEAGPSRISWTLGQCRAWRVDITFFPIKIRRLAMRFRAKVIVAALVMIPAVLTQTPARAGWCAEYSGLGGTESCIFSTFEQCQASVSGVGGFCRPSQYNSGNASAGRSNKKRWY
jgi:hypothetical protein